MLRKLGVVLFQYCIKNVCPDFYFNFRPCPFIQITAEYFQNDLNCYKNKQKDCAVL